MGEVEVVFPHALDFCLTTFSSFLFFFLLSPPLQTSTHNFIPMSYWNLVSLGILAMILLTICTPCTDKVEHF